MSKTVAVISDSGLLVDALGRNKEAHSRYSKFAGRLIGANGTTATIDYGWNGASKLNVSKGGARGQLINLNAESVLVAGSLSVGGIPLDEIIGTCTDLAIRGIQGTEHEVVVTISENDTGSSDSSSEEQPRLSCTISLSPEVLNRIQAIESTLDDLFRFDEVYRIGDGLMVTREENNVLSLKLGTGLKFDDEGTSGTDEQAPVTLDMDTTPTQGSVKPVTSGGVYAAIHDGMLTEYYVGIDATTGNMTLYHNTEDS